MAQLSYEELFKGSELFFELLIKQSLRPHDVMARIYMNGAWHQISGRDFCAHLGRAVDFWLKEFPLSQRLSDKKTVILIQRNSYNSFIATLGAICAGLNVMCAPANMQKKDMQWCIDYFGAIGVAGDLDDFLNKHENFQIPIINISSVAWLPHDQHLEPELLSQYRTYKALKNPLAQSSFQNNPKNHSQSPAAEMQEDKAWKTTPPGRLCFVSLGHDGFQKPEAHLIDVLLLTAQNFLLHINVPSDISFKNIELLTPSTPFVHFSRFAILLKNGILGFPNPSADWEVNLKILRPTLLFVNNTELEHVCNFIQQAAKQKMNSVRLNLSNKLESFRSIMQSRRAMKIREEMFHLANRVMLKTSRLIVGKSFIKNSVEDLKFIIHGLSPANEA
ncbi:MAG: hypothetical protein K2X39_02475, partial [Silvanigrellaceae bacterium]|nr:hypothetical protein [Silvanigrellaceae bacterium]